MILVIYINEGHNKIVTIWMSDSLLINARKLHRTIWRRKLADALKTKELFWNNEYESKQKHQGIRNTHFASIFRQFCPFFQRNRLTLQMAAAQLLRAPSPAVLRSRRLECAQYNLSIADIYSRLIKCAVCHGVCKGYVDVDVMSVLYMCWFVCIYLTYVQSTNGPQGKSQAFSQLYCEITSKTKPLHEIRRRLLLFSTSTETSQKLQTLC